MVAKGLGLSRNKVFLYHQESFLFLRDTSGGPLQPSYDGPYQVIQRETKTFTVKINNKNMSEMKEHRNSSLDSREYRNVVT